jgi:hypothetical protein
VLQVPTPSALPHTWTLKWVYKELGGVTCGRRSGGRRQGNHSTDSRMGLRRLFRGGQGNRILLHPAVRGAGGIRCEQRGLREDSSSSRPPQRRHQESVVTIVAFGRSSCPGGHRGHWVQLQLPVHEAGDPSRTFQILRCPAPRVGSTRP